LAFCAKVGLPGQARQHPVKLSGRQKEQEPAEGVSRGYSSQL
jgi:hypothetical protein